MVGFLKPLSMGRQRFQMDDRANFTKETVRIREEGVNNFKGSTTQKVVTESNKDVQNTVQQLIF